MKRYDNALIETVGGDLMWHTYIAGSLVRVQWMKRNRGLLGQYCPRPHRLACRITGARTTQCSHTHTHRRGHVRSVQLAKKKRIPFNYSIDWNEEKKLRIIDGNTIVLPLQIGPCAKWESTNICALCSVANCRTNTTARFLFTKKSARLAQPTIYIINYIAIRLLFYSRSKMTTLEYVYIDALKKKTKVQMTSNRNWQ